MGYVDFFTFLIPLYGLSLGQGIFEYYRQQTATHPNDICPGPMEWKAAMNKSG